MKEKFSFKIPEFIRNKNIFNKKNYFILLFTLFLILIFNYFKSPKIKYDGILNLKNLKKDVEVYFDDFGSPHIFAENNDDLFFSAGYIMARERLFQLTINAYTSEGRLSEILGEESFEIDKFIHTWGIPRTAKKMVNDLDKYSLNILNQFCEGVNQYIKDLKNNLPVEFKILQIKPIQWKPYHISGFSKLMAYSLSQSWHPEMLFGQVASMMGENKTLELWPYFPNEKPDKLPEIKFDNSKIREKIVKIDEKLRNILGTASGHLGSNSWVVDGSKTISGKPILSNDPHLGMIQPSIWYEMHLNGGDFNVSGVTFPGIPFIIIGQNEKTAWGFTNLMSDDLDFFHEKINPDNQNQYFFNGKYIDMKIRYEKIKIRGNKEKLIEIRETHRGPIISDIHPLTKELSNVFSFSWVGNEYWNEIESFIKLNKMTNWSDFSDAVSGMSAPAQNIVYADIDGNIGWRAVGKIPIRDGGNFLLPLPGETSKYDWKGYIPFDEMPYEFNPDRGYIITANNKTISNDYNYYVSSLWHNSSRYDRIFDLINDRKDLNQNDMKIIQNDLISPFAKKISNKIVFSFQNYNFLNNNIKYSIELLNNWDGNFKKNSTEPLIFSTILMKMLKNIYSDEMTVIGENVYSSWIGPVGGRGNWAISLRNLEGLMSGQYSSWVDNIETLNYVENLDDIIIKSVKEAVSELENELGYSSVNWWWGRSHKLTFRHSIGNEIKILDRIFNFNIGPFETGGSSTTINNGEYSFSKPFSQTAGASFRRIVDFSNLDSTAFILTTGQSGDFNSIHYKDQTPLYLTNQYRTIYFDKKSIENFSKNKLSLESE